MSDAHDSGLGDTFTETTSKSWLQRIISSFVGVLVGLVLIVASIVGIFWNEGRAIDTARALAEGAGAVVSVDASAVDPANEGKLVHVMGAASATRAARRPAIPGQGDRTETACARSKCINGASRSAARRATSSAAARRR